MNEVSRIYPIYDTNKIVEENIINTDIDTDIETDVETNILADKDTENIEIVIHSNTNTDTTYENSNITYSDNNENTIIYSNRIKNTIIIFFFIFTFPILFCDIYFSVKYNVCLLPKIYEYLIYSGVLNIIFLYPFFIYKLYIDEEFIFKYLNYHLMLMFVEFCFKIFLIIWTLIGITNFFQNIKKIICDNTDVLEYLFFSSVIKIIYMIIYVYIESIKKPNINI
jgi:hypothetical protein